MFFSLNFLSFFSVNDPLVLTQHNGYRGMRHLIGKYEVTDINQVLHFKMKIGKAVLAVLINSPNSEEKEALKSCLKISYAWGCNQRM